MDIRIEQLTNIDKQTLETMTKWMYDWWGEENGYNIEAVQCFMEHSLMKDRLPQTYGLFLDNKIIGMYQFAYEDLSIRPDIYPWLANVYIDHEYRGKGYARILLENVKKTAREVIKFDEIFLYTKHIGLYEKFGWEYVSDLDTYNKEPRIQRLYKMELT